MADVVLPPKTGDSSLDYWAYEITEQVNNGTGTSSSSSSDSSIVYDEDSGEITAGDTLLGYVHRYLDVAYGTSSSGANFTNRISTLPAGTSEFWQGIRNQTGTAQSTNAGDFTWNRISSADSDTRAFYRVSGGRSIVWLFRDTDAVTDYVRETGAIIDLDTLPAGPTGPAGTGAPGADGTNGQDGLTTATITIYRRVASAPGTPSDSTYTVDSDSFTLPTNWSRSIPSGTNPVWASSASFSTRNPTVTLNWNTPVQLTVNGEDGSDGATGATGSTGATGPRSVSGVVWRTTVDSDTDQATPSADSWSFTTGRFSNLTTGWGYGQPAADTTNSRNQAWHSTFYVLEDSFGGTQTITFQTPEGTKLFGTDIQSDNYVAGSSGWKIDRESGSAEFEDATIRGAITATSLTIDSDATVNGTISANNIAIDGQTLSINASGQLTVNQGDLISQLLNAPANLGNISNSGFSAYNRTFNNNITINNIQGSGSGGIRVTSNSGNIIVTGNISVSGSGGVRLSAPNGCVVFNGALSATGSGGYHTTTSSGNVCAV